MINHQVELIASFDHGFDRVPGVRRLELWTADRDFGRFPGLPVRNSLVR